MTKDRQLEWQLMDLSGENPGQVRQAANPTLAASAQSLGLHHNVEILYGRVVDAIPYTGCYKVLPERGLSVITCQYMSPAGNGAYGARGVSSIPPGAHVWFIYHHNLNYGVIIGTSSYFMSNSSQGLSDFFFIGSRSGLFRDVAHSFPFTLNTRGIGDWSAGKPFDSTTAGEWGAITETGTRVLLDSFMVQVGAGEGCGFYAYLWDNLARVIGVNLQVWSNTAQRDSLDDDSEHYDIEGFCTYPWETLGLGRQGGEATIEKTAQQTEIDEPWYGAVEPYDDRQQAVQRMQHINGYLGQGGTRRLMAPTTGERNTLQNAVAQAALFEEHIALTGRYTLRTADEVIIARRPLIPTITQQERPESPTGDKTDNYKASGMFGAGDEHKVVGSLKIPDGAEDPHVLEAAAFQDIQAYVFNWDAVHPFHYHKKDWKVSEESDTELGSSVPAPDFSKLAQHKNMYLDGPETVTINVDHRYGDVTYALASSYFTLLHNGGVVLGDGFGSEIRMSGGHIDISAPGDIWLKSGRNTVQWGGRDVITRAGNCCDISTTSGDIRLKAEKHLWGLAGNSGGDGIVMLESKGTTDQYNFESPDNFAEDATGSGVVLRSATGNIVNWAKDIYLRTGGGPVATGNITLDAAQGESNIITNSASILNFLRNTSSAEVLQIYYDLQDDKAQIGSIHSWTYNNMSINGSAQINGNLIVNGSIVSNQTIYVNDGHIATSQAAQFDGKVAEISANSQTSLFQSLAQNQQTQNQQITKYYTDTLFNGWYDKYKAGNADVMTIGEFCFRTAKDQYNTLSSDDQLQFRMFESRWQQMLSGGGQAWKEPKVKSAQVDGTAPYPGLEVFSNTSSFIKANLLLFDNASGTAKSRSGDSNPYLTAELGEPTRQALNNYTRLG